MALHTPRPEEFMGQVERNLVTSATLEPPKSLNMNMVNSLPLASILASRLQGMSPLFNTALPAIPNDQLLNVATNQLLASLLYQPPLSTTTNVPDMMRQVFPIHKSISVLAYKPSANSA